MERRHLQLADQDPAIKGLYASIRRFQDAADVWKQLSKTPSTQILPDDRRRISFSETYLANIEIGVKKILEEYIPLRLVSGESVKQLSDLIQEIWECLRDNSPFGSEFSRTKFEKLYLKFANDLAVIDLVNTDERKRSLGGKRLLCIDGGGVRGLCALLTLQALMHAIRAVERSEPLSLKGKQWDNDDKDENRRLPLPKDYFDLVGGTSTGGLIGIMLFRLGMTVSDVKARYDKLSKTIFKPGFSRFFGGNFFKPILNRPWFSGTRLENAIRNVVKEQERFRKQPPPIGHLRALADAPLMRPDPLGDLNSKDECQLFVCAVEKRTKRTVNFRTYKPNNLTVTESVKCTIVDAARATSAAPFYFPAKDINKRTYWDGGLQNNNPICQVLAEVGPHIPALVISLGTGRPSDQNDEGISKHQANKKPSDDNLDTDDTFKLKHGKKSWFPAYSQATAVFNFVTDSESNHDNFKSILAHHKIDYFRLNPIFEKPVSLSAYEEMSYLTKRTKEYLETAEIQEQLVQIAKVLLRKLDPLDPLGKDDKQHPESKTPKVNFQEVEELRDADSLPRTKEVGTQTEGNDGDQHFRILDVQTLKMQDCQHPQSPDICHMGPVDSTGDDEDLKPTLNTGSAISLVIQDANFDNKAAGFAEMSGAFAERPRGEDSQSCGQRQGRVDTSEEIQVSVHGVNGF